MSIALMASVTSRTRSFPFARANNRTTEGATWAPSAMISAKMRSSASTSPTIPGSRCERSEEHTSELQSRGHLVCRLLLEKKKPIPNGYHQRDWIGVKSSGDEVEDGNCFAIKPMGVLGNLYHRRLSRTPCNHLQLSKTNTK